MNIWETERNRLIDKIMEERGRYLLRFGLDPDFVVIPKHYSPLLGPQDEYLISTCDNYYGMQIIESRACSNIDEVKVY